MPSILSHRASGTRTGLINTLLIGIFSLSIAAGQSSTTFKKQLKHDEDKAEFNELYRVTDNIALLAYSGYKGFGYVRSFSIASDGSTIQQLAELKFDDEDARMVDIEQVASDLFVVAYTGRSNDGFITTIKVSADGKTITQPKKLEHDTANAAGSRLARVDSDTYALYYYSDGAYVKTFDIPADGSTITEVAKAKSPNSINIGTVYMGDFIKSDQGFYIAASAYSNSTYVTTWTISDDGKTIAQKKYHTISNFKDGVSVVQLDSDTYVFAATGYGRYTLNDSQYWGAMVKTVDIAVDGSTITEVNGMTLVNSNVKSHSSIVKVSGNIVAFASNHANKGKIDHVKVSSDGKTLNYVHSLTYYNSTSNYNSMIKMNSNDVYLVAHSDGSSLGYLQTFTMRTDLPYSTAYSLAADNTTMTITFNEPVFSTNAGSGELEPADFRFDLALNGGTKRLNSNTPKSISKSGNVYTLTPDYNASYPMATGVEVLDLTINTNSVYDADGNLIAGNQLAPRNIVSNLGVWLYKKTLNDFLLPYVTSSSTGLSNSNTPFEVTFNEEVFSKNDGTGALEKEDFVLAVTGGIGKLSSATPTSISKSGNKYTLGVGTTGLFNGKEVLSAVPASGAIFDKRGNIAATSQSNNTVAMNDNRIAMEKEMSFYSSTSRDFAMLKTGASNIMMKWRRSSWDGMVNLFSFDNAGTFTSNKSVELVRDGGLDSDLIKGPGNIYIGAEQGYYRENNFNKWGLLISTISTDGTNDVQIIDTERMTQNSNDNTTSYYKQPSLAALNDSIYVVGYRGYGYDGFIETFKVSASGQITRLQSYEYDTNETNDNKLVRVDNNTVAILFRGYQSGWGGYVMTLDIAPDGSSITKVATKKVHNNIYHTEFFHLRDDLYVAAYQGDSGDGYITTLSISKDGKTIEIKKEFEHETVQNSYNSLIKTGPNNVALAYAGVGDDGFFKTFTISADGATITEEIKVEHEKNYAVYNEMIQIEHNRFALAYYNQNGWGYIRTLKYNDLYTATKAGEQSSVGVDANNKISITFSKDAFNTSSGSGDLEASDFAATLTGGSATLKSATPLSISKVSNTVYQLELSLDGTPNGGELVTISPAANAIYDANGTALLQDQSDRSQAYLKDKTVSLFTSIKNNFNENINLEFSEPVFSTANGNGNIATSDFVLSISGGTATLAQNTPTSVTGKGAEDANQSFGNRFTLGIGLSGNANGEEKIKVSPANGTSIYDVYGNAMPTSQSLSEILLSKEKILNKGVLEFDNSQGRMASLAEISPGIFLISYSGPSDDGYLMTIKVASDGTITKLAQLENDTNYLWRNDLLKMYEDLYVLAYKNGSNHLNLHTLKIPTDGSSITVAQKTKIDNYNYNKTDLVRLDKNTVLLSYEGHSSDGFIRSIDIAPDGTFTTVETWEHDQERGMMGSLVNVSPNTFALAYHGYRDHQNSGYSWGHKIITFSVDDDGKNFKGIATLHHDKETSSNVGYGADFVKIDEDSYALAYRTYNLSRWMAKVKTFTISSDGKSIAQESEQEVFEGKTGAYIGESISLLKMDSDNLLLRVDDEGYDGYLKSYAVSNGGKTLTNDWYFEFEKTYTRYNTSKGLAKIDKNSYLIAYSDGSSDGYVKIFDIENTDTQKPKILNTKMSPDNVTVFVELNEETYRSKSGALSLEKTDFELKLAAGTATLSGKNPTAIMKTEDGYMLTIGINGLADGNEKLTVDFAADAVFDGMGNAADASQSNNVLTLKEKTPPTIVSTTLSEDNVKAVVTISEAVFRAANGSGALQTSDFSLALSGGTATLQNSTPTAISIDGNKYTLTISYNGVANGTETLTITPVADQIFDAASNVASTTQNNNKLALNEVRIKPVTVLEYDNSQGTWASMQPRDADTHVIAYADNYSDGLIKTFNVAADGTTVTNVNTWKHDSGNGTYNSLARRSDDVYALAYRASSSRGNIRTFKVAANGTISSLNVLQFDTQTSENSLIQLKGDLFLLAYSGSSDDGMIKSFNIGTNGSISGLKTLEHNTTMGWAPALHKMTDSTAVLIYSDHNNTTHEIKTFHVASDGTITEKKKVKISDNKAYWNSIAQVDTDTYLIAAEAKDNDGYMYTYDISPDGTTITKVAELEFDEYQSRFHELYSLGSNSFLLAHAGSDQTTGTYGGTYTKIFTVPADGSKIKQIYNTKISDHSNSQIGLSKLDADTYLMADSRKSNDGFLQSLTVKAGDTVLPVISYVAINDDNASVAVTFNEETYNTAGASGSVEKTDFALSIAGGSAKLASATPTSISLTSKTYTLGFTLSGTADGNEVLKVSTVSNQIFDGGGNAAVVDQTNGSGNLKDKSGPKITKTVLANDNATVTITLSEKAFGTGSGSGSIDKADFALSITGGTATLASAAPTSISISGNDYTLGFSLTGSPDGNEVLKVSPVTKSIYDKIGNESDVIQLNNTANLKDIVPAIIESVKIAASNDILQVFFNEAVFGKNDGSGALESSDFSLSLAGGEATLTKNFPTTISGSGTKVLSLGVLLTGNPNGEEVLKVNPKASAVYDGRGNVTKATQSNNTIQLTDKLLPFFTGGALTPSNTSVSVTFNEKVYAKNNATGSLEVTDFELSVAGGTATIKNSTPDSVGIVGNTYSLGLSLEGLPSGSETLTVKPKSSAIFDGTGNNASTTQNFSTYTLNDKLPPRVKGLSLASDNSTVTIDFTENVFSTALAKGDLDKNDFVLTIDGETVVLNSPFPTSISKSGNSYTLGIGSRGDPTGVEELTVLLVENAIFDAAGNAANMTQNLRTVKLNDKDAPQITDLTLSTNNRILTVVMSEKVFSSDDGSGLIDSTAFALTINDGNAQLLSQYPSSVKYTDNTSTFELGLPLKLVADGTETLTIGFTSKGMYDASGTAAAETQKINSVKLFDLSAPIITESKLDSDNEKAMVRFSVPVFADAKSSLALEVDDFKLSLVGGTATLKSTTPSSIESSENGKRYKVGLNVIGVPDGREVLTINPVDNNIYDDAANPANKIQDNNSMNLFDKQPPVITSVNLSKANDTLFVTLSEAAYAKESGTSALVTSDFTLSIVSGFSKLTNPNPSAVTHLGSNVYALTFGISGTPDGREELFVTPSSNSIFDASGNIAATKQSNNSVYLNDQKAPTAPQGLVAIPGNTQATISWRASSENDISKYYIYGGTAIDPSTVMDSVNYGSNTKIISGLTNETRYYFKLSSLDKTGYESPKSDTASVVPTTTRSLTVKADGTGDFTAIQDAIDAAISGDSIYMDPGTYDSIRVDSKSIQIIAGEGPTKSFIDAKGLTTAVILSGYPNQTKISGFTILNGIGDLNANGNGGGIRVEPGVKASIDNCVLTGNKDGAIFFGDSSETIVTNTLTYGNDKSLIFGSGTASFINSTFADNQSQSIVESDANITFVNSIFMDRIDLNESVSNVSIASDYSLFRYGDESFNLNYIKNFYWGPFNLKADPMFVDTLIQDYHLQKESPAIGVGIGSLVINGVTYTAPEKDLDGNIRPGPAGSAPDLGIYESPYSSSAPSANQISDGLIDSIEVDYSSSNTTISGRWKRFGGASTYYEYAVGTSSTKRNDIVDWTIVGVDTSITNSSLDLKNSETYYLSVRGRNALGESSIVTSDGVFIDFENPKIKAVTELKEDVEWLGPNTPGHIFVHATDNSEIVDYSFSVGTIAGSDDVVTWTHSDSSSILFDLSMLNERDTYVSNARVTDIVGFISSASSDSFRMDLTPPLQGRLSIGDLYQSDTANVTFTWSGFIDEHSGISDYQYALGTEPGSDNVIARTPLGLNADFASLAITISGLSLEVNQTYYGTVYALDKVSNETFAISDGLTIDRDGPESGTIYDGIVADIDHSNDTTSASASWNDFYDFNGIDRYELALYMIGNTGAEVLAVDWTDVGKNLSYTFNNISLNPNYKYYFSIKAFDKLGNASNIEITDGFIVDVDLPTISMASVSPEELQSVMLPLSIDFSLSEIAQSADVSFGSARGDLSNIEPRFVLDSSNLNISYTPPFTSGDQITLDINVTDLAGNTSETISYTYTIGYLGDYDFDNEIGINDLNSFINGWRLDKDISKELGPVTGSAPYFRPQPDGVFDLRDGMTFVRMWRWYQSNAAGKVLAKQLPSIGKQVAIESAPDHFTIVPPRGTKAVEVIVSYPVRDIDLQINSIEAVTDQAITLSWVDTTSGSILVHSAQLEGSSTPIRINVGHLQKELDIPIDISYQFIGKESNMIASGNAVHEIMPVPTEFALHNNYPNPFNPITTINYDLPQDGSVRLIIYDVMGREVTRLVNGFTPAGYHSVRWDARNKMGENVSAGVYFYHLQSGAFVKTQKMVLLK